MRTPSKDQIKWQEGRFYLVREVSYNGGSSEKVSWNVCEKLQPKPDYPVTGELWRLIRDHKTKRDAIHFLFICAKV